MTDTTTVVSFRADRAAECLTRFLDFAGDVPVTDLGVLDEAWRFRVPAQAWSLYTRSVSGPKAARR